MVNKKVQEKFCIWFDYKMLTQMFYYCTLDSSIYGTEMQIIIAAAMGEQSAMGKKLRKVATVGKFVRHTNALFVNFKQIICNCDLQA